MKSDSPTTDVTTSQSMPQVPFGPYMVSRLILGGNPTNGGSHMSSLIDKEMRRFFTPERILQLLSDSESKGINAWQTCPTTRFPSNLDIYRQHKERGGKVHYMSIATEMPLRGGPAPDNFGIASIVEAGAIAIAHWGSFTDIAWRSGQMDQVHDFLLKVRDAGVLVGLSTHKPEVVDYVESKGWDVDFYMTCLYRPEQTREEVQSLLGYVPVPGNGREVYLEDDPPRMFKAIQQTSRTCLAFKILAAGRLCRRQETVEQAFKETFSQIKARDAVIVGMYPKYEDQVQLNAGYTCKHSGLSKEF